MTDSKDFAESQTLSSDDEEMLHTRAQFWLYQRGAKTKAGRCFPSWDRSNDHPGSGRRYVKLELQMLRPVYVLELIYNSTLCGTPSLSMYYFDSYCIWRYFISRVRRSLTEVAPPLIVQPPAATMTTLRSPACVAESVGRRAFCILPDLEITDDRWAAVSGD